VFYSSEPVLSVYYQLLKEAMSDDSQWRRETHKEIQQNLEKLRKMDKKAGDNLYRPTPSQKH